jgi:hypothetical protein
MMAELGPSTRGKFSNKLHMLLLASLHHQLLRASRNRVDRLWRLELWHLCGLHKLLDEILKVALDIRPCLCIRGGD